jgi:hypothetical protein
MTEQKNAVSVGGPFHGELLWVSTPDVDVVRMKDGVRYRYTSTSEIRTDPDHGQLWVFEYAGDGG